MELNPIPVVKKKSTNGHENMQTRDVIYGYALATDSALSRFFEDNIIPPASVHIPRGINGKALHLCWAVNDFVNMTKKGNRDSVIADVFDRMGYMLHLSKSIDRMDFDTAQKFHKGGMRLDTGPLVDHAYFDNMIVPHIQNLILRTRDIDLPHWAVERLILQHFCLEVILERINFIPNMPSKYWIL